MNDLHSTYEYAVAKKREGAYKWARVWLIIGYIFYVITFFSVGVMSKLLVPCIALVPVTTWIVIYFTWRYVNIDYEYSTTSGIITFSKIFGNRSRKTVTEIVIKNAVAIAPLTNTLQKSKLDAYAPEIVYNALSTADVEDGYFMIYEDESGRKCAFLFEATAQMLKICRYYNPSATVVTQVRY